jgi:hypothetical protein
VKFLLGRSALGDVHDIDGWRLVRQFPDATLEILRNLFRGISFAKAQRYTDRSFDLAGARPLSARRLPFKNPTQSNR